MNCKSSGETGVDRAGFDRTSWTVVVAAKDQGSPEGVRALGDLFVIYRRPLHRYVLSKVNSEEDAEDLVQLFFARMIEKGTLNSVDKSKGKFRAFLLASLKNLMLNEWARLNAQKRGGKYSIDSLEEIEDEKNVQIRSSDGTPEDAYDRQWAETVLLHSIDLLRREWEGRGASFDDIKEFVLGRKASGYLDRAAARLGRSRDSAKAIIYRNRSRLKEIFRQVVAETVAHPNDVDEEVSYLRRLLGSKDIDNLHD